MKNNMEAPKKLRPEVAYDPAIPLLSVYPKKTIIQNIHVSQCSHYLQQPGHGSNLNVHQQRDDKDVVHTYNGVLLSHKKDGIMPFAET